MIGATGSKQSGILGNKINIYHLLRLQKDRGPAVVECAGDLNDRRLEKFGSGKVMPLLACIDEVQAIRLPVAQGELVGDELVFDHPDLDSLRLRPVDRAGRIGLRNCNKSYEDQRAEKS